MALSARDRGLYARHLLLSQLGEAGQERLLASSVRAAADADPSALEVAKSYLERAGVSFGQGRTLALPTRAAVEQLAGSPALLEAARALSGALSAVQAIVDAAEIPQGATRAMPFTISSEDV